MLQLFPVLDLPSASKFHTYSVLLPSSYSFLLLTSTNINGCSSLSTQPHVPSLLLTIEVLSLSLDKMLDHPTPPSSASRVRESQVENAFPTPPRPNDSDSSLPANGRASPGPRKFMNFQRAQSTPPDLTDSSRIRSLTRGTDGALPDIHNLEQSWSRLHLSKKKSQYYSDVFAYREPNNSARDRVVRDSVILADVKLNCCVSKISARL